jgi:hypothetical protein
LKRARKKQARRERYLKRMKSRGKWKHGRSNVEKVRRLEEACALARARAQKLIPYSDSLSVVIALSTGSTKKKPMTKKEREEKRRKHKEKRLKK